MNFHNFFNLKLKSKDKFNHFQIDNSIQILDFVLIQILNPYQINKKVKNVIFTDLEISTEKTLKAFYKKLKSNVRQPFKERYVC